MSRDVIVMLLGAWVALLSILGFPTNIKEVLYIVTGVIIISVGVLMRRATARSAAKSSASLAPMPPPSVPEVGITERPHKIQG